MTSTETSTSGNAHVEEVNDQVHSILHSGLNHKLDGMDDEMAPDPNIEHLHALVAAFRASEAETKRLRADVDRFIQEMKRQGYSYPLLAKESTFAQGTIQLIVAKDPVQAPDLQ